MAALDATMPTLLDIARRSDMAGKIDSDIIEILDQQDDGLIQTAVTVEGNLPTGHTTTVRTGIPAATWRKFNQGVQPNKSTTVQITDNCGMLEAYAEVDAALARLNGNEAGWLLSENKPHIEGMYQEFRQTFFYGNEGTEPEAFTGIAPRFNALSGFAAADNVIDGGSNDTDNTSIYLVGWGPHSVHLITPKGSKTGLSMTNMGEVTIESQGGVSGARMQALRTHYKWDVGLCVRDWRYIVRIANIEVSDLVKDAATGADLVDLMMQALEQIYSLSGCRPAFYVSRRIRSMLRRQERNAIKNSSLGYEDMYGRKVLTCDGVPVYRCDAIAADETRLT